jgi:putative transposase
LERKDQQRGRQVWYNCFERPIKSERHFWATLNYVHHNPVHHGYVERWQEWPWSSAAIFLESIGKEKAKGIWKDYPILDYGKKWDI